MIFLAVGVLISIVTIVAYYSGRSDGYTEGYTDGYLEGTDPNDRWL